MKISHYKYITNKFGLLDKSDYHTIQGVFAEAVVEPANIDDMAIVKSPGPLKLWYIIGEHRAIFGPFKHRRKANHILGEIKTTEILFL